MKLPQKFHSFLQKDFAFLLQLPKIFFSIVVHLIPTKNMVDQLEVVIFFLMDMKHHVLENMDQENQLFFYFEPQNKINEFFTFISVYVFLFKIKN